jgi:hypothetical protein
VWIVALEMRNVSVDVVRLSLAFLRQADVKLRREMSMRTRSFRNTFIVALIAWNALPQACSSEGTTAPRASGGAAGTGKGGTGFADASSGAGGVAGSSGKGGSGGGAATGGTGGTSGKGGSSGDGGPQTIPCGSAMCAGVVTPMGATVAPCCSPATKCGLQLDMPTASALGLAEGCNELGQVGSRDSACPDGELSFTFQQPDGGTFVQTVNFPGCCRSNQTCGIVIDQGLLHFGCTPSTLMRKGDAAVPGSCTFNPDAGSADAGGSDARSD